MGRTGSGHFNSLVSVDHLTILEILKREIDGASEAHAVAATLALGHISSNEAQPTLCDCLQSRKAGVVKAALQMLEKIDNIHPGTVKAIRQCMDTDPKDRIREMASGVIEILTETLVDNAPQCSFTAR